MARELTSSADLDAWPVVDEQGFRGMVRNQDLEMELASGGAQKTLADLLDGSGLVGHELPHVHPDHSLGLALERMGSSGLHVLPVLARSNVRQLIGIVTLKEILSAYGVSDSASRRDGSGTA